MVCACGREKRGAAPGATGALPSSGPDPIVVRIPRDGGVGRAYRYPNLDSLIWRAQQKSPALDRLLAFDAENGVLAYLTRDGTGGWVDLRLGTVRSAIHARLTSITSADGWSIFGVNEKNAVVRLTPSGDWELPTRGTVRRLFPLADGTLVALVDRGAQSVLLRMRPPDEVVDDSLEVPHPDRAVPTPMGDRLYLGAKRELLSVRPQQFNGVEKVRADDDILAIAPTPSGDRVFIANKGGPRLEVLNRYTGDIEGSVTLPGLVTDLRMDPLGRFLLARPVSGDSAWVIAIANDELVGTVRSEWRSDLPAVAADGMVATVSGADVAFVDAAKGTVARRAPGGASDLWFFTLWNGLRPRARGLDEAVSFSLGDSAAPPRTDTAGRPATPATTGDVRDTAAAVVTEAPPPAPPAASRDRWTVSFAAVLSEERAREIADGITVEGQHPRVLRGETAGTVVFRVVVGPYSSKADAERMGRASKHNYWVYEGIP